MTLTDFIEKYTDVAVDWDKAYGAQCVDLVRQYWNDVWKIRKAEQPEGTGTQGAAVFYYQHLNRPKQKKNMDCITYTKGLIPPPGAVVIFGSTPKNSFGHIGICTGSDQSGMDVFEQDGIYNSRAIRDGRDEKGAYIIRWNYDRLLGWLMKKEC